MTDEYTGMRPDYPQGPAELPPVVVMLPMGIHEAERVFLRSVGDYCAVRLNGRRFNAILVSIEDTMPHTGVWFTFQPTGAPL